MTPTSFLDSLVGEWCVKRRVFHENGESFEFEGVGIFERIDKSRLRFYESGTLTSTNAILIETRRTYLYEVSRDNSIRVSFEDGADFFQFDTRNLSSVKVEHLCGEDVYRGLMKYKQDEIIQDWRVVGPNKSYTSCTVLSRESNQ